MAPLLWPYFKYSCIALDNGLLEVANAWGHRSTFSIPNVDSQNSQSISVVSGVSLAYSAIQAGAVPHLSTFQRLLLLDNENKTLARLLSTPTGQMVLPGASVGLSPSEENFVPVSTWPHERLDSLCRSGGLTFSVERFDSIQAMVDRHPGAVRIPWIYKPTLIQRGLRRRP